jgi:uncharacterized protein
MQPEPSASTTMTASAPWWRHGFVWLVIAGPLAVVVAGFVTLWLAIRIPDPVVAEDYYRRGNALPKQASAPRGLAPALQGRNHAVTPAPDEARP